MFEFKACEALKLGVPIVRDDQFSGKHNEEVGLYGQTLIKKTL